MGAVDYIIISAVALILTLAVVYVIRAKKKGKKCIGCSQSCGNCCSRCGSCKSNDT